MDQKKTMENLARAAYEKGGFNGAWLYAEKGKIVSSGAFGWVDAENTLPMREDSIFEMASVTKMFTATAVMLLVREGKLGLDDAYTKYFPDYPYEGVTILKDKKRRRGCHGAELVRAGVESRCRGFR